MNLLTVALGGLALVLGVASLWKLTEQDIYWQVRAGAELLRNLRFPERDTWSYSVPGAPWMNIQWLSTLLFRGAFALGAEPALIVLRGALVAILIALAGGTLLAVEVAGTPARQRLASLLTILPLTYIALQPRLQIRSDLLVLIVFAALLRLWTGPAPPRARRWGTWALVVLAANLHAGTAPFVVLVALTCTLGQPGPWTVRLRDGAVAGLAFFLTPYSHRVLPLLWAHLLYYRHSAMQNPDHQPFTWAYARGWPGAAALLLGLGGLAAAWRLGIRGPARRWPEGYGALPGVAATGACLVALSADRVRAIPYATLYFLPILGRGLSLGRIPGRVRGALAASTLAVLGIGVAGMRPSWGFTADDQLFPVGSTRFVAAVHPSPNILHTFAYGAYLVWYLRDYRLYVDTRETMFWPLEREILDAYASPEVTRSLAERYHVNTVMMPIPAGHYIPGLGFEDLVDRYLPEEAWAVVYFDKISFVALRRIPEHAEVIAAHEYRVLRPGVPGNTYPLSKRRNTELDRRFEAELQRCLRDEPESACCLVAQAAWWRTTDPERYHRDALPLLERARAALPPRSGQYATVLVELQAAYRERGMEAAARAIDDALGPAVEQP